MLLTATVKVKDVKNLRMLSSCVPLLAKIEVTDVVSPELVFADGDTVTNIANFDNALIRILPVITYTYEKENYSTEDTANFFQMLKKNPLLGLCFIAHEIKISDEKMYMVYDGKTYTGAETVFKELQIIKKKFMSQNQAGIFKQISNAAKAVKKNIHGIRASDKAKKERHDLCADCPFRSGEDLNVMSRCTACGCILMDSDKRPYPGKTSLAAESCPLGKWDADYESLEGDI